MKYTLYESVDELIAPETLRAVAGQSVTAVRCTPMEGGLAGSRLLLVDTDGDEPRQYVLKCMSPQFDWLMQTSADQYCRSVSLWQYGLLDRLHPNVDHTIIACARDGNDGWAILMHNASEVLMTSEPWTAAEVKSQLDTLALIHATFWGASELAEPAIGLCDSENMIRTFSLSAVRKFVDATSPAPSMVCEGWTLLQEQLEPDVACALTKLQEDPHSLCQALARYPITLVHGDYRGANLGLIRHRPTTRSVVLDWQLAGRSIPTIDLAWFLTKESVILSPLSFEVAIGYYRQQLTQLLGNRFDPAQWQPMLDLGLLVDIMRCGSLHAWIAVKRDNESQRIASQRMLEKYNVQVRAALKWLQ